MKPVFAALLLILNAAATWASGSPSSEGLCSPFESKNHFRNSAGKIDWKGSVLSSFDRTFTDPRLNQEADLNVKANANGTYKALLAAHHVDEADLREYNYQRIASESASGDFESHYAAQAYCVKAFVNRESQKEFELIDRCNKATRSAECQEKFPSVASLKKAERDLISMVTQANRTLKTASSKASTRDYLGDLDVSMKSLDTRIQELMKKGLSFAQARSQALAEAKKKYSDTKLGNANVLKADDVFRNCHHQLGDKDDKSILPQIASGNCNAGPIDKNFSAQMASFHEMDRGVMKDQAGKLGKEIYRASLMSTAKQYLDSYRRLNGKYPAFSWFCKEINACNNGELSAMWKDSFSEKIPKTDVKAQMADFNAKVSALNQACRSRNTAQINQSYQTVLYGTSLGGLLPLSDFSDQVGGGFDESACREGKDGLKLLPSGGEAGVRVALNQTLNILKDKAKELVSEKDDLTDQNDPYDGLRYFLEFDPLVVREMLRKQNNPDQARLLCFQINEIYRKSKNKRIWTGVLTGLSIAGSLVATVLSGGIASPLLVAAIGAASVGTGLIAAGVNVQDDWRRSQLTEQGAMSNSIDLQTAQALMKSYDMDMKGEAVGVALMFVPGAGKAAGKAVGRALENTVIKAAVLDATKGANLWIRGSKLGKPIAQLFAKVGTKAGATMVDFEVALASKVGKNTAKAMVVTFNDVARGMPSDVAMNFATQALIDPDPYSKEGMIRLLKSVAMSRGLAAIGNSGRAFLMEHGINLGSVARVSTPKTIGPDRIPAMSVTQLNSIDQMAHSLSKNQGETKYLKQTLEGLPLKDRELILSNPEKLKHFFQYSQSNLENLSIMSDPTLPPVKKKIIHDFGLDEYSPLFELDTQFGGEGSPRWLGAHDRSQFAQKIYEKFGSHPELLEKLHGSSLIHGSNSSSLLTFTKYGNFKGELIPTGQLEAGGKIPFGGEIELGRGFKEFQNSPDFKNKVGVNQNHLSTASVLDAETALYYTKIANGWSPSTGRKVLQSSPSLNVKEVTEKRLQQWSQLTAEEKRLVEEGFPVIYAIKPNRPGSIANVQGDKQEIAIKNGAKSDEIRTIFVPKDKVLLVQKILSRSGSKVDVADMALLAEGH